MPSSAASAVSYAAADPAPPLVPNILYIEDYKLDLTNHAFFAADGREIALTRAEASLLTELARSPGLALSRDQLRRGVAGRSAEAFERSIDMVVTRLRRKIEINPQLPRLLVTVPGVGYKLAARPQSTDVRQSQLPAAEPEKRPITVLACEPVGAMELALKSDPEDLSRMIRAFQDAAISAIRQMGGTIATVAPDQVLALFGYPEAHEDDAERAVDAGLDVIAQISARSPPQGFQVRLGIASGLALTTERKPSENHHLWPSACAIWPRPTLCSLLRVRADFWAAVSSAKAPTNMSSRERPNHSTPAA